MCRAIVAIPVGLLFGSEAAQAAHGGGGRPAGCCAIDAVASLGGALLGEGLLVGREALRYWPSDVGRTLLAAALVIGGLGTPASTLRQPRDQTLAIAITAGVGLLAFVAHDWVRTPVDDRLHQL